MNDLDLTGWRAIPESKIRVGQEYLLHGHNGNQPTAYVREQPVPPLPTEPYTVIRVFWREGKRPAASASNQEELVLIGSAWMSANTPAVLHDARLPGCIVGFEVLSEPRAVTAKAVLARVDEISDGTWEETRDDIAREFGVES